MSRSTSGNLLDRAQEYRFCQADLKALQSELPDDDEIDRLLSEAVDGRDEVAFTHIVLAALDLERPVDAKHLAGGAALLPDPGILAAVAMRCTGDAASPLIEAVRRGGMGREREAAALLICALWSRGQGEETVSRDLVAQARILCRLSVANTAARSLLASLADFIDDEGMKSALGGHDSMWTNAHEIPDLLRKQYEKPLFDLVPERPASSTSDGHTIRRAVARVGRNDPCPCGSGKKYKKCCIDKDHERLSRSSEVPGVTVDELRRNPERHLTEQRLFEMRSYELVRLDPSLVREDFHLPLVERLLLYREFEAAVRLFETVRFRPDFKYPLEEALRSAAQEARKDLVERLVAVRQDAGMAVEPLNLGTRLLLADRESEALDLIEAAVRKAIETDDVVAIVDFAYDLLHSGTPAVGILVARSVLPICSPLDASMLIEELLSVRDEMYLAPWDPFEEVLDALSLEDAGRYREESKASSEALDRLEEKRAEAAGLRKQLARLQAELEQREAESARKASTPTAPAAPTLPAEREREPEPEPEPIVRELRAKMESLKTDLKQRHLERNSLRNELRKTHEDLAALRNAAEAPAPTDRQAEDAEEESMLVEEQFQGSQPIRTPSYPGRFRTDLENVPEHVARLALRLIGKLAAGDVSAFVGSKRLTAKHEVLRQRVGQRHRLLYRLHDDTLEVVTLIHRRDLERTIKRLE